MNTDSSHIPMHMTFFSNLCEFILVVNVCVCVRMRVLHACANVCAWVCARVCMCAHVNMRMFVWMHISVCVR